jgi:hypothetical protein
MPSNAPLVTRYILITLHTLLAFALLIINAVASLDLVVLIASAIWVIGWFIYIPAAIVLTARKSDKTFMSGGGEVAYVVVQWVVSLSEFTF